MLKDYTKTEKSWIFYDWANSAYTMVVTSTIMTLYFMSSATTALEGQVENPTVVASAYWGYANSIATAILVVLSPILGTLADYKGRKKRYFNFFFFTGVIFTAVPVSYTHLIINRLSIIEKQLGSGSFSRKEETVKNPEPGADETVKKEDELPKAIPCLLYTSRCV